MAKIAGSDLKLFIGDEEVKGVVSIEIDLPSLGISVEVDPEVGLPPGPKTFTITTAGWDPGWILAAALRNPSLPPGLLFGPTPVPLPPSLFRAGAVTWDELKAAGPGFEVGIKGYDLEDEDL